MDDQPARRPHECAHPGDGDGDARAFPSPGNIVQMRSRSRASALPEFVFIPPVPLLPPLGLGGSGVEVSAQVGLVAGGEEAGHGAAVAPSAAVAVDQGTTRGYEVGSGYRLGNGTLRVSVDARQFGPGGRVGATATYRLGRTEIPLLAGLELSLEQDHVERVSQFRSFPHTAGSTTPWT